MYIALLLLMLACGTALVISGIKHKKRLRLVAGAMVFVGTLAFFKLLDFWGEALWFAAIDQSNRFLTDVLAKIGFAGLGGLAASIVIYLIGLTIPRERKLTRMVSIAAACIYGVFWGYGNWDTALRFWHRTSTGIADPILGRDTGLYSSMLPRLKSGDFRSSRNSRSRPFSRISICSTMLGLETGTLSTPSTRSYNMDKLER